MFEAVGAENFFLFGLTADEVLALKSKGYNPHEIYMRDSELKQVIDLIQSGIISKGDTNLFRPLIDSLLGDDPYIVLQDFQSYIASQQKVSEAYRNKNNWIKMSILNVARMGKFSSDRSIRDYCENIWHIKQPG